MHLSSKITFLTQGGKGAYYNNLSQDKNILNQKEKKKTITWTKESVTYRNPYSTLFWKLPEP